jgi:hypothetical protein
VSDYQKERWFRKKKLEEVPKEEKKEEKVEEVKEVKKKRKKKKEHAHFFKFLEKKYLPFKYIQ